MRSSTLSASGKASVRAAISAARSSGRDLTALSWNFLASSGLRQRVTDACLAGPLRGLAAHFSQVICSWHIKARKPEAASFERAAGRLGCSPTQLLLLDDSLENTVAAVQCGWDACCISSIDELVAALRDTIKG